ncbi:MAG: DUF6036 family nucleotidyltransferase [Pseudomonadota bacterium]
MKAIDLKTIKKFVEMAVEKLPGDWVIMGGSVLPLLGKQIRVTQDIDVAGPKNSTLEHTLKLMEIAEELNLPPEAINQAGAFFLNRIPHWKNHLILVAKGKKGAFYRPDLWLFIRLKISRLSESDLSDCIHMIDEVEEAELEPKKEIVNFMKAELAKEDPQSARGKRIQELIKAIS